MKVLGKKLLKKLFLKLMIKRLTRTIPPLRGPNPQGLNVPNKKVIVTNSGKLNGNYRQITSKRS